MYQQFYGLRELPFELTPDPRFLFFTPSHREALSNLQYGLTSAKAVTVLIGEAGTGKTTLIRAALESETCRKVRCVDLNNPALTRAEFVGDACCAVRAQSAGSGFEGGDAARARGDPLRAPRTG